MKKILSLILVFVLLAAALVSCGGASKEDLQKATDYVKSMYKSLLTNSETASDFELVSAVKVSGVDYTVTWTSNNDIAKVVAGEGKVTIDINDETAEEVAYELTAVVSSTDGKKGDPLTFKLKVPASNLVSIPDAIAAEDGTFVTVKGTVVRIDTPWDEGYGNISVTIADAEGNKLYLYRLSTNVALGDVIKVKGEMATYNNARQIAQGATADIVGHENVSVTYKPVTIPEALTTEDGVEVEVSGTVTIINTPWNDGYKNISVTIEDKDGNQLYLYRLSTNVALGDVIKVQGVVGSYNGQKQIAQGATAEITGHENVSVTYKPVTIPEALATADNEPVEVKGTVTKINEAWSDSYKNISVTISDDKGNTLYIYRLATNVALGDIITVKGYVGSYNDAKQIAQGATAEITGKDPTVTEAPTTTPATPTTTVTPSTGDTPTTTDNSQTPETPTEKTLVLDPSNFNKISAITLNGVVENTRYTNEFTFQKGGSYMTSTEIKGITKIVAHVFGTYDNLKMYQGTSNQGTLITATVKDVVADNGYTDKEYTYTFVGGTDAFFLENPSEHTVNPYTITIYYTGAEIGGSTPTPPTTNTPTTTEKPSTPIDPGNTTPLSEIISIGEALEENATSTATYTVTGIVTAVATGEITISQNGTDLKCYYGKTLTGENLYMGYTVTLTGTVKNYYGTIELVEFAVDSFTAATYTATMNDVVNGTISLSKVSGIKWGETVTVTVAPANGYVLDALKINGLKVDVTNGTATVTVDRNLSIEASFVKAGEEAKDLATFTFGANGATGHKDGTEVKTEYTETSGSYTLTLTELSKVFSGGNDEKGNSFLKLGTGSAVGGFTLTAPAGVDKVVFYIAKYKAKATTVTINGQEIAITTSSNDGAYTAIEIDVSTNKTITFETTASATRCVIDKIVFQG